MMLGAILMMLDTFVVILVPLPGTPGGVQNVEIQARDRNAANVLAEAQYRGRYKINGSYKK